MAEQEAVQTAQAAPEAPAVPETPAASGQEPAQTQAGEATATPTGEKPAQDKTGDSPEKPGQSRFQRRIDKAYRKAAEARGEADFYKRQLESARQQQQQPADPNAPRLGDFDDVEKYAAAREKYASERVLKQQEAHRKAQSHQQAHDQMLGNWEARTDKGEEKYPDFAEKVGDIKPTTPWAVAIMNAENGEDVAYHLGSNLDLAQQISSLPPLQQFLAIGRLSEKLAAQPARPKTPSKAPAPINPVSGSASPSATPSSRDDFGAWMKSEQQREGKLARR